MSKPAIIKEEPLSLFEVRAALEKIKARDKELGFRALKTEDYLTQFVKLSEKQAAELEKKFSSLNIPRLKDLHIKKIVSILPRTLEDLKVVLQGYTLTLKDDALNKIMGVLHEFGSQKISS